MVFMSKPRHTETGQLLDTGVDLNMEGGIAEYVLNFFFQYMLHFLGFRHVKDIIILTAGSQLLASTISNYFWLLWLLAPIRGLWILWKNILAPYIFQPAPVSTEADEKKQKKMERKMKRQR